MIPRETEPSVDEARLIEEIRAGNTDGFEYFVRQYQRKITRVAYRLLRDVGEADCAAQESFLRAWQNLNAFREGSTFETWLTRICINWCKDRLKRRRIVLYFHQSPDAGDEAGPRDTALDDDPSPERRALSREIPARLAAAIGAPSPPQKPDSSPKHLAE